MRTAWVFPGQGSLRRGCVRAVEQPEAVPAVEAAAAAAGAAIDEVAAATGLDVRTLADEPGTGARTADAQPAILAASLGAAAALRAAGLRPDIVAGHSLGECTAAIVSGALTPGDGARVVSARGAAMARACAENPGAMAAVVKLAPAAVDELLSRHPDVVVANDNAPGQVVVAGPLDAVAQIRGTARELGGRAVLLEVEGAFHSPAMAPARDDLTAALATTAARDPEIAVLTGTTVAPLDSGAAVVDALIEGLLSPVRWREVQLALAAAGVTHIVEVGPGGVLAGLASRTVPDVEVTSVVTAADAVELRDRLAAAVPR